MKNLFLVLILSIIVSCETAEKKDDQKTNPTEELTKKVPYASFGAQIEEKDAYSSERLNELYLGMEVGDTVDVKFASKVNSVCKKKGCWMKLELAEDKETMVRFKDYGFFVPKNSEGRDVIVEGFAFLDETSVDDLKHYAEDEGKSKEEIEAITEPKITYSFTATGVLVQGTDEEFESQVEKVEEIKEKTEEVETE
ncbi:DUF4920 domain-containing protein [Psychroflexus planctonicus]|uniref:DUF4920 domain-containing protein n=1 Tax=Psychroflexus planctonicus TaxID=1526575 RepID=A0ABQ1SHT4_9FLAO|nr:DUF4920 domain-containing protein [Psychroflexus planctonicus]GGE37032.1 hypothetical protein GCM10010832_16530 [Psychroflexus planctonicus]